MIIESSSSHHPGVLSPHISHETTAFYEMRGAWDAVQKIACLVAQVAAGALCTSVVLTAASIGVGFISASVSNSIIPSGIVSCVGLIFTYIFYNTYRLSSNVYDVANNLTLYRHENHLGPQPDSDLLRERLREKTIAFDWFIGKTTQWFESQGLAEKFVVSIHD